MRVLHLDAGNEMRGGQWQVLRLLEGLIAAGVECTLLARAEAPLFEAARARGWRAEALGWARAAALARANDVVHAHDARSHTVAVMARAAPLVVARRVAFPIGSRWKYGRAAHYIAVSEFVKSVLVAGGVAPEKTSVVYDGVPLLAPAHGTAAIAPANSADPQKGAALAQEAACLAGVPLRLSAELERDLQETGVFVYITHSEGLGSAVLLAMSSAIPVVASNVGGLREIIRHGENGLLVENSAAAIAAALREIVADPERARRMGEAARRTVEERFTIGRMVSRTMEVYRQVLV